MSSSSVTRRATAAWKEPTQEIRTPLSPLWLSAKQPAYYKSKGLTLCQQMENLYKTYGYYKENLISQTFKGMEGKAKIDALMESFRCQHPEEA